MSEPKNKKNPWRAAGLVSAVGLDLVACTLAGFWLGQWLSSITGGSPIWIAVGVLLGVAAGIVSIFYLIRKFVED